MIKRTLYFGNPAYLSTENKQLLIKRQDTEVLHVPIEDIGIVLLDHPQITITQPLLVQLTENNVALITCNATHHPVALHLAMEANTLHSQRAQAQVTASLPLKKQLWQQTIKAKIRNQAAVLGLHANKDSHYLLQMAELVKSGDAGNIEARAAVFYWPLVFPSVPDFNRERIGLSPNPALNYGYAILRALVARSLVASGLLPALGIFHRNQYNAYCLADDIMEPYRPYVDYVVLQLLNEGCDLNELTPGIKKRLLQVPVMDVQMEARTSPLMNAVNRTCSSLVHCFEKKERKIAYPEMPL